VDVTPTSSDGRPGCGAAIGILPVCQDDPTAPSGCAALREFRGRPLVVWALDRLLAADPDGGLVGEVVVAVPRHLAGEVASRLGRPDPAAADSAAAVRPTGPVRPTAPGRLDGRSIRVVPVDGRGVGDLVLDVLAQVEDAGQVVVVHDPLQALAPPEALWQVVEALGAGQEAATRAGAVPVRPVSDTLKLVGGDGAVVTTADRDRYRVVGSPQAYRAGALRAVLAAATDGQRAGTGPQLLPMLVRDAGLGLSLLPAAGDVVRLAGAADIALAEAGPLTAAGERERSAAARPVPGPPGR